MAKFKKGDIVKVVNKESCCYGEILIVKEESTLIDCLDVNGKYCGYFDQDSLELATGYDAIAKGTVLRFKNGDTCRVLGICGELYFVSSAQYHYVYGVAITRKDIEENYEPPTPIEDKGTEVFDKDGNSLGFVKDGKVITN